MIMKVLSKKLVKGSLLSVAASAALLVVPPMSSQIMTEAGFNGFAIGAAHAERVKRTQTISQKVFKQIVAAQELTEAKQYSAAKAVLNKIKNGRGRLNDAETASVLNVEAFISYAQGNTRGAISAYQQISRLSKAPEGVKTNALYSLAQLYYATDQFRQGVDTLKRWFAVAPSISAGQYMLLGQGYFQLKDYNNALVNVEKAIGMFKAKGKKPKESWLSLQRFLYYDKKDYRKAITVLEELIRYYPKKEYWIQISALKGELKQELEQLAAMETAYMQNMLTKDKEIINMAYVFLANDIPYKAAKVLEKGFKQKKIPENAKNLELIANSYRSAQEVKKAVPYMERAATKSDKGELWARLGSVYLDREEFKKSINAVKKGLSKGGVKRPDQANLVLGMAHFNLKQYKSALSAFQKAKSDKRSAAFADQWINYMNKEIERQKSLQAPQEIKQEAKAEEGKAPKA